MFVSTTLIANSSPVDTEAYSIAYDDCFSDNSSFHLTCLQQLLTLPNSILHVSSLSSSLIALVGPGIVSYISGLSPEPRKPSIFCTGLSP